MSATGFIGILLARSAHGAAASSKMELPAGVLKFCHTIAETLTISSEEALLHVTEASPGLRDYISSYSHARLRYSAAINAVDCSRPSRFVALSGESHFNGSYVVHDTDSSGVLYSAERANPTAFWQLSEWYCAEMETRCFARRLMQMDNGTVVRPFFQNTGVVNYASASVSAGLALALSWFTATTDLHHDNVLFDEDGLIILDDECTAHPVRKSQLQALGAGRRSYPFSPFRTILIQESVMSDRKARAGLSDLLAHADFREQFIDSFMRGVDFLRGNTDNILYAYSECGRNGGAIRYLMRGTEFYDACIYAVALLLFHNNDLSTIRTRLHRLYESEIALFPETACVVGEEIECLLSGQVPYWRLRIEDGALINSVGTEVKFIIPAPREWLEYHLAMVAEWSPNKIRQAVETMSL